MEFIINSLGYLRLDDDHKATGDPGDPQVSHLCDRFATLADEQASHQASITGTGRVCWRWPSGTGSFLRFLMDNRDRRKIFECFVIKIASLCFQLFCDISLAFFTSQLLARLDGCTDRGTSVSTGVRRSCACGDQARSFGLSEPTPFWLKVAKFVEPT